MEPIKQALERARRERNRGGRVLSPNSRSKKNPAGEAIAYTQTVSRRLDEGHLRMNRVIAGIEDGKIIDQYKVLRTRVLQRLRANNWNVLGITSPAAGQGKTITTINLAISLAREVNHTVLLADLDLRRPNVHNVLGFDPVHEIGDYIYNDTPLAQILFNPGVERLVILPGKTSYAHSSEILSSPKMVELAEDVRNRYPSRIVLLDMPPLLAGDDVIAFLPYVHAVLLVVEERKTLRDDVKRSMELLEETEVLGTVMNNATEPGTSSYYYY